MKSAWLLFALSASSGSLACTVEPPFVPALPNESEEQRSERFARALADRSALWEYERQKALVERSAGAFLGEVLSSSASSGGAQGAVVKPLLALKGPLPTQSVRLETRDVGQCTPFPAVDGEGALAKVGDLVFVFTGLEPHPTFRPRGIDSLKVNRILNDSLREALERYGLETVYN